MRKALFHLEHRSSPEPQRMWEVEAQSAASHQKADGDNQTPYPPLRILEVTRELPVQVGYVHCCVTLCLDSGTWGLDEARLGD